MIHRYKESPPNVEGLNRDKQGRPSQPQTIPRRADRVIYFSPFFFNGTIFLSNSNESNLPPNFSSTSGIICP